MNKILNITQITEIVNSIKNDNKTIVLTGGFFDILHIGHIKFLQKAKEKADFLFVLLESDENAKKLKGKGRPINNQQIRAEMLSAINFVDYVIKLPEMKNNTDYDKLINLINPDIFAVSQNDKNLNHKIRQAETLGAKVIEVTPEISNQSTTKIIKILEQETL